MVSHLVKTQVGYKFSRSSEQCYRYVLGAFCNLKVRNIVSGLEWPGAERWFCREVTGWGGQVYFLWWLYFIWRPEQQILLSLTRCNRIFSESASNTIFPNYTRSLSPILALLLKTSRTRKLRPANIFHVSQPCNRTGHIARYSTYNPSISMKYQSGSTNPTIHCTSLEPWI